MTPVETVLPAIGSRWTRANYDPEKGAYNAYEILFITNTAHVSDKHPPQIVYRGDNGHYWSRPFEKWPGALIPEGCAMPLEKHRARHVLLHKELDELIADFIRHTGGLPSKTTLLEFLNWSHLQTLRPTPTEKDSHV